MQYSKFHIEYSKWKRKEIDVLNFSNWPPYLYGIAINLIYNFENYLYTKKFDNVIDRDTIKINYNRINYCVFIYDDKGNLGIINPYDNLIHLVDLDGKYI